MLRSTRFARAATVIAGAVLVLVAVVAPVSAGSSKAVTIVSHMQFHDNAFNTGDFVASGAAVDAGLICGSGTVEDYFLIFAGGQSGRGAQIPVRKAFTCNDGTGVIFIKIQVHLDFNTGTERFTWVVLGGTGDYASLVGNGNGSTVGDGSDPQTGNINTYLGTLNH